MSEIDVRNLPDKAKQIDVVFSDKRSGTYKGHAFYFSPSNNNIKLVDGDGDKSKPYISVDDLDNAIKALKYIRDNLV